MGADAGMDVSVWVWVGEVKGWGGGVCVVVEEGGCEEFNKSIEILLN